MRKQPNRIVRFIHESNAELRKVSWPTRQEARRLTIIVLVVVTISSVVLGTLDYLFTKLIGWILTLGA
ncbi:MAG: preprotein translocase subunit SecE [Anaerolineales bacterium]|nr:preprotein translocase subunit SecE [Anaerolineales bacterium]